MENFFFKFEEKNRIDNGNTMQKQEKESNEIKGEKNHKYSIY